MKSHHSRFSGIRVCVASASVFILAAGSGTVYADMTPLTGVDVQVVGGATGGNFQDQQNSTNVDAPSLASVSKGVAGGDGSTAGASAAAFADFGTLGVGGTAGGAVPPATPAGVASGAALASAFWDDFLTAFPNPGSLLVPGTSVTADLSLGLDFQNSTLAINNANSFFAYELFAGIVLRDPVTGVQSSSTVLDDCFVFNDPDFNLCGRGSNRIDIPGNTNGQPLNIQFAPIALSLAILQPFELGVGLTFDGQCNTGPNDTAISSCSLDGDALHTSITTLQPLGGFTLVAASGHDYSLPITTPPGSVPEPGTLALIVSGLAPAALSLRARRKAQATR
jgi:hypothetical protein